MKKTLIDQKSIEVKLPPPKENPNKAEFGDLAAFVDEATIQKYDLKRDPTQYGEQRQY